MVSAKKQPTAPSSDGKREQREGITIARFWVPIVCDKKNPDGKKPTTQNKKRNLHNIFPLYFVVIAIYEKKSIWSHLKNNNDNNLSSHHFEKNLKNLKNRNKNKNNDPIKTRKHTF